ncbi:M23 family metallopeptidase [Vaginella massiliensis]|uniref:M23 family metallopeptidase n=1 Tax=Vaginella massiliensis TaxID=1816680 RepID=UPI000838D23E|nr:M23 family metallopeptidase [Vaginella massiliensis]
MKKFYSILFILTGIFSFAQFNTIRKTIKVEEKTTTSINENIEEQNKLDSKANKVKKTFKITSKSDLKNEIDSLKILIKEIKNEKAYYNQIKDSLMENSRRNILFANSIEKETKPNYTIYNFIDEPISKIFMPIKNKIHITSPFGVRKHPISGVMKMHNGIDIRANYEDVLSVLDGVVVESGWDSKGGGHYIKINHFDRFETSYLHLHESYYKKGEIVKAGYVIGLSGNSGGSTAPHLHFSVKEWGRFINPVKFLNDIIKVNNLIAMNYE